jgi:hypothetical protein
MVNEASDSVSGIFRNVPVLAKNQDILSEAQRRAIDLLIEGKSQVKVAESVSVTARTLYNWMHDDDFRIALDARRRDLWATAAERLRAMLHPAIDVLEAQLSNPYEPLRIRAANALLRLTDLRKAVPPEKEDSQ